MTLSIGDLKRLLKHCAKFKTLDVALLKKKKKNTKKKRRRRRTQCLIINSWIYYVASDKITTNFGNHFMVLTKE